MRRVYRSFTRIARRDRCSHTNIPGRNTAPLKDTINTICTRYPVYPGWTTSIKIEGCFDVHNKQCNEPRYEVHTTKHKTNNTAGYPIQYIQSLKATHLEHFMVLSCHDGRSCSTLSRQQRVKLLRLQLTTTTIRSSSPLSSVAVPWYSQTSTGRARPPAAASTRRSCPSSPRDGTTTPAS